MYHEQIMVKISQTALLLFLSLAVGARLQCQDTLMGILDKSMVKIQEDYFKKEQPPYFIDMRVHDLKTSLVQYSSGILLISKP